MDAQHGRSLALAGLMAEGRIPGRNHPFEISALNNNNNEMDTLDANVFMSKSLLGGSESSQVSHSSSLESLDSNPGSLINHIGSQEPDDGSTSCSEDSFEMSSTCSTRDSPGHSPGHREGTSSSFTSGGTEYKLDYESSSAPTREGSSEREVASMIPSITASQRKGPSTSMSMDSFLLKDRITCLRESVDELDTRLPAFDFENLEKQLQSAAKEREDNERKLLGEEVRRRLAMQVDVLSGPSPSISTRPNRSNLALRLQTAMNLQVCYINEMSETSEAETSSGSGSSSESEDECRMPKSRSVPCFRTKTRENPHFNELKQRATIGDPLDPAERQELLNAETKATLANSKKEGQKALEAYRRTKSRASELPRQSRQLLSRLSIAEIAEILRKIEDAIAGKNTELVKLLIERDTLHMEHDSLLVDIEDFQEHEVESPAIDLKRLIHLQEHPEEARQFVHEQRQRPPQSTRPARPKTLGTLGIFSQKTQNPNHLSDQQSSSPFAQLSPSKIFSNLKLFRR